MQQILFAAVTMRFVGQHDVADRPAMSFDGVVHPFALNREGAGVIVHFSMYEQQGCRDLIGIIEGAHVEVQLRVLPVAAGLRSGSQRE